MSGLPEGAFTSDLIPARALLAAVMDHLDKRYPHWRASSRALPEGLRLELHPHAYHLVMRDEYARDWPLKVGEWHQVFGVPVKVNADLGDGYWRLVVVTEDVLLGGRMPGVSDSKSARDNRAPEVA